MIIGDLEFELDGVKSIFNMDIEIFVKFEIFSGKPIKAVEKGDFYHFTATGSRKKLEIHSFEFRLTSPEVRKIRKPSRSFRKSRFSL